MERTADIKKSILSHLQNGLIESAQAEVDSFRNSFPSSPYDIAQLLYLEAKIFMYRGQYRKAMHALQASIVYLPENLTAICDLALCYHHLGLRSALEDELKRSLTLFEESDFPEQEEIDNTIVIAKIFEEMGSVDKSLKILKSLSVKNIDPKQIQAVEIQLLRLNLEIEENKAALNLYYKVLSGQEHTQNFELEREHVLLLADCKIFGVSQGLERFQYIMKQNLPNADTHFFISEMAEQIILSKELSQLSNIDLQINLEDEYEKAQTHLIKSYIEANRKFSLEITHLEKLLSPMSLLRLIRQAFILFPYIKKDRNTLLRYQFHCSMIPYKKLQDIFINALKEEGSQTLIFFNSADCQLMFGDQMITFKSALFWKLIALFSDNRTEISLDEAIKFIYDEELNLQHFDRIRIAVSRLNSNLRSAGIINSVFKVSKEKITLLIEARESA